MNSIQLGLMQPNKKPNLSQVFGIKYTQSSDVMVRTGKSFGLVANAGASANDFNNCMPWAGMRRCNLADDGITVNAYYGEVGYVEDGSNGQCMVEVPAFWYRVIYNKYDEVEWFISPTNVKGTKLHPWFYDELGDPVSKKYISTYEGSLYDVSASQYKLADEQVADFTATTGDKLCSVANAKPCSGLTQDLNIVKSRVLARNRGEKWQQLYFNGVSAVQMLFVVEYASFNTQLKIGLGVVAKTDDGSTNMANNTGATTTLGNISGRQVGTDGLTSVSYRGVENLWGNIWAWVDGLNIRNGFMYKATRNSSFVSDIISENYTLAGELAHSYGYASDPLLSRVFESGFMPTNIIGSSSTKFCDYYYQNSVGTFVAQLGGRWADGASAGAFFWGLHNGSAGRNRYLGARLCV